MSAQIKNQFFAVVFLCAGLCGCSDAWVPTAAGDSGRPTIVLGGAFSKALAETFSVEGTSELSNISRKVSINRTENAIAQMRLHADSQKSVTPPPTPEIASVGCDDKAERQILPHQTNAGRLPIKLNIDDLNGKTFSGIMLCGQLAVTSVSFSLAAKRIDFVDAKLVIGSKTKNFSILSSSIVLSGQNEITVTSLVQPKGSIRAASLQLGTDALARLWAPTAPTSTSTTSPTAEASGHLSVIYSTPDSILANSAPAQIRGEAETIINDN